MDKVSMTIEELNAAINAAVNAAMDAYQARQKKDILVPRRMAMRLLGKSASTMWRWERDSYLVPVRRGSSVLYRSCDLARLGVEIDA